MWMVAGVGQEICLESKDWRWFETHVVWDRTVAFL